MTAQGLYQKYRRICLDREETPMAYHDFLEACVTSYMVYYVGEANRRIKALNREVRIARHNFKRIYDLRGARSPEAAAAEAHEIAAIVLGLPNKAAPRQRGLFE